MIRPLYAMASAAIFPFTGSIEPIRKITGLIADSTPHLFRKTTAPDSPWFSRVRMRCRGASQTGNRVPGAGSRSSGYSARGMSFAFPPQAVRIPASTIPWTDMVLRPPGFLPRSGFGEYHIRSNPLGDGSACVRYCRFFGTEIVRSPG